MSVVLINEGDRTSKTKNERSIGNDIEDYIETLPHYRELTEAGKLLIEYTKDGITMILISSLLTNVDWDIISEYISDDRLQLHDLSLGTRSYKNNVIGLAESGFVRLIRAIGAHKTLESLFIGFGTVRNHDRSVVLLDGLRDNRSIKYLGVYSEEFDLETAYAFAQMLENNQSLISLKMELYADLSYDHYDEASYKLITDECVVEIARSLQRTAIKQLRIRKIKDEGFRLLTTYLPKTLVHLDLTDNEMSEHSIPVLDSYLKSNGYNLKELILNNGIPIQDLLDKTLSSSSMVQIVNESSWEATIFRKEDSLSIISSSENDSDWSFLAKELTKNDTSVRKLTLKGSFNVNDKNQMNSLRIILGKQSLLTDLTFHELDDPSFQIEFFRMLKENKSITNFVNYCTMNPEVLTEFGNLLKNKNNFTFLHFYNTEGITDEDAIVWADSLTSNTVLQHFGINYMNQIGDIGFQALLSSLSQSMRRLILRKNLITEKSLPFIFNFIKNHPELQEISLKDNGISSTSPDINVPDLLEKIFQVANENHCLCELDISETVKETLARSINGHINLYSADLRDNHLLELCNAIQRDPKQNWLLNLEKNNRISHVGYSHLAKVLSSTIYILELSLEDNRMNEEARATLFHALSDNKTLRKVVLNGNELTNQDIEYIGCFVKNNPVLKEIELHKCNIGDDSAVHLAKALSKSNLEKLDLSDNSLGDFGCAAVLSDIPPVLTNLSLCHNNITESSFQTIVNFLANNHTLKTLDLNDNPIYGKYLSNEENYICKQQLNEIAKQNGICELT